MYNFEFGWFSVDLYDADLKEIAASKNNKECLKYPIIGYKF